MFKKSLLLLLALLLLFLGGCAEFSGASAGKIIPPSNPVSPLGGKWSVLQELDSNGSSGRGAAQQWVGSDVQFATDAVSFGGQVWANPTYKIKRVKADDYLLTKYIAPAGISGPIFQKVDVITVYAAGNYLGEFMKLDDVETIFFVHNKALLLKKVADQADSTLNAANTNARNLSEDSREGSSGVLLGLRTPSASGYTYQTLWIAVEQKQLKPLLASEQIFFPRTSGFWELSVRNLPTAIGAGNLMTARNVTAKAPDLKKGEEESDAVAEVEIGTERETETETGKRTYPDSAERVINYIGNDYVAIEKREVAYNHLQVFPVDKISSSAGIKVSDLLGVKGLNAYLNAREQATATLKEKGISTTNQDVSEEDFGLTRKNGRWSLVGRIHYQKGGDFQETDFDLKMIPPTNLIFYDTLVLSWYKIKDRVPDALDAFTSPNQDIALVKTKNKLTIYPVGTENLGETPLAELDLPEGATVIMAEWATGSYVDSWEKSFLAYGAQALASGSVRIR
ncbi:MAG: hypothetical protein ACRKFN_08630 [Desulfitobacterium sp.]